MFMLSAWKECDLDVAVTQRCPGTFLTRTNPVTEHPGPSIFFTVCVSTGWRIASSVSL